MSRIRVSLLLALTLLLGGCGYGSHYNGGGGAGAPAIASLAPATTNAGDPAFTLTVNGSGFGTDSVVYWNGTALPSSYGTGTRVTAQVTATDVANVGMIPVYVRSGGKNSNSVMFTVQ
jgi:hypothetical protein